MAEGIARVQGDGGHTVGHIGIVDMLWRAWRRRYYAERLAWRSLRLATRTGATYNMIAATIADRQLQVRDS